MTKLQSGATVGFLAVLSQSPGYRASIRCHFLSSQWHRLAKGLTVWALTAPANSATSSDKQASTQPIVLKWYIHCHLEITKKCHLQCHQQLVGVGSPIPKQNPEAKLWFISEHVSPAAHLRKDS